MSSSKRKRKNILVTGGAGYIGSQVVLALNEEGYNVTVLDNLTKGVASAVLPPAKLVIADLEEIDKLDEIFRVGQFSSIFHFAGKTSVPESVIDPMDYYSNNVSGIIALLKVVERYEVSRLIFSSSAAVYGISNKQPVSEQTTTFPISPYGRSKLMGEWILQDFAQSAPWFRFGILRYFNVAGCDPHGRLGQNDPDATHLIKMVCQAALNLRKQFEVFGDNYPTIDGTGVRDFIHVYDLANAHVVLLKTLEDRGDSHILNCGCGKGYSVLEVVNVVKEVAGVDFPVVISSKRDGDIPYMVADIQLILSSTSWRPVQSSLRQIVESAFYWEKQQEYCEPDNRN